MTHILRLADEANSVIIDLNDPTGAIRLVSYQIVQPSTQLAEVRDFLRSGGEIPRIVRDNVTETLVVRITGADPDAVTTQSQAIKRVFIRAERQQMIGTREKRYIHFLADGASGNIWRSEILLGDISLPPAGLDWQWANRGVEFKITWRRRFYWETRDYVNLPLDNTFYTAELGGATLYNHNDSGTGHDNYVIVKAGAVTGDLPSPVRISMLNNEPTNRMSDMYIGHNVSHDPDTASDNFFAQSGAYWIEGESADTGGSTVVVSSASGGNVRRFTWSGTSDTILGTWLLNGTILNAAKGGRFKFLLRYNGAAPANVYLQLELLIGTVSVAYAGGTVLIGGTEIVDLGALPLPPWRQSAETYITYGFNQRMTLRLRGQSTDSGSHTVDVDYIQITPLDGYHFLDDRGFSASDGIKLVDDSASGDVFTKNWSSENIIFNFNREGAPIMIWPTEDNGYCFLHINNLGNAIPDRTFILTIEHRPRRIAV